MRGGQAAVQAGCRGEDDECDRADGGQPGQQDDERAEPGHGYADAADRVGQQEFEASGFLIAGHAPGGQPDGEYQQHDRQDVREELAVQVAGR
jgi:hypothetical protein